MDGHSGCNRLRIKIKGGISEGRWSKTSHQKQNTDQRRILITNSLKKTHKVQ